MEVNKTELQAFAQRLGTLLAGNETIELVGDVGSGKTTFVKAMAHGLVVHDEVQSPSFTINRVYRARDGLYLHHYDFYRLSEAGVMASDLAEAVADAHTVVAVEWGSAIEAVLPVDRLTITLTAVDEYHRRLELLPSGPQSQQLVEQLI